MPQTTPERWVGDHGDYLFRQALARVGQREIAEDLVQETFAAAWESRARFAGRASEHTWLCRILRNKIADHFRKLKQGIEFSDAETLARVEAEQFHSGWLGSAHWHMPIAPRAWRNPRESLELEEFWETVHGCAAKLPQKVAQAFLLREVEEWSSERICDQLQIQRSHLFVMLYRARLALRRCLELRWFQRSPGKRIDRT